jgi:hypothetical protein
MLPHDHNLKVSHDVNRMFKKMLRIARTDQDNIQKMRSIYLHSCVIVIEDKVNTKAAENHLGSPFFGVKSINDSASTKY